MGDRIQLLVDGLQYSGWKAVEVGRSIEACAGSFSLSIHDRPDWRIANGALVQVLVVGADGQARPFMTAYVDVVRRELGDATTFGVAGRDVTADLVDSSADVESGELHNVTVLDIAEMLARPHGLTVALAPGADVGARFEVFAINVGETAWEMLERALRVRGLLAFCSSDGTLLLASPATRRAGVSLVEGQNIRAISVTVDDSTRYRTYRVRGQRPGNDEDFAAAIAEAEGQAQDLAARGNRVLELTIEQGADVDDCTRRAQWEATVRAARASTVEVVVQGWREQANGPLWDLNVLVDVDSPTAGVAGELLVTAVRYVQDDTGTWCQLALRRPDAFVPEPELPPDRIRFGEATDDTDEGL